MLLIALKSLWSRRAVLLLTLLGIAISVVLLVGVQRLRQQAHDSFANTVSGADLLVGARTGPVNLLLYSIFHIGNATNNVSYATYSKLAASGVMEWTIPLSLGDMHRGWRVLGTSNAYFEHYSYAGGRPLAFAAGRGFQGAHDAVLGATVARRLGYGLGQKITVSHGAGEVSFVQHDGFPLFVVGILRATGTPVDRVVHVTLEGVRGMHAGAADEQAREEADPFSPMALTAFLVGLKSPAMTFVAQRAINGFHQEALTALIPGQTLQELWDSLGMAEAALTLIAGFVVLAGLLGMMTSVLTTLYARRREIAILRAVGARPAHIFLLLMGEVLLLAIGGEIVGIVTLDILLAAGAPLLEERFGLFTTAKVLTPLDVKLLVLVLIGAVLVGLIPAWRAYRNTLADGLAPRL